MKHVLVIIGKRPQEKEVIAQFKAAHSLTEADSFVKILIGPERLSQNSQEWVVFTPENWRLEGEGKYSPLETYVRRRMKGGDIKVFYVNLDVDRVRCDAVNRDLSSLGWKPFDLKTPAAC